MQVKHSWRPFASKGTGPVPISSDLFLSLPRREVPVANEHFDLSSSAAGLIDFISKCVVTFAGSSGFKVR